MWTHAMNGPAAWWMWTLMVVATVAFWLMVALVVRLLLDRPTAPPHQGGGPGWGRLSSPEDERPAQGAPLGADLSGGPLAWRGSTPPRQWP